MPNLQNSSQERIPVSQFFGQTISGICWDTGRLCFLNATGNPMFTVEASMIYGTNGNFLNTDEVAMSAGASHA